jgi:DNA-binding response OmpR family regulator
MISFRGQLAILRNAIATSPLTAKVMAKILVIEDDEVCAGVIQDLLVHSGYTVEVVSDGGEGLDRLRLYHYDLAVIDWQLPKVTGITICSEIRNRGNAVPILMLTGKTAIPDKEKGFIAGVDDYLTKPFDARELLMRVKAILRRPAEFVPDKVIVGDICLDGASRSVTKGGNEIALLPKEYSLLEFLLRHPNQVFDLGTLLNRVWPSESDSSAEALRKCVERIRKKIDEPGKPSIIETVHRVGYVFRC